MAGSLTLPRVVRKTVGEIGMDITKHHTKGKVGLGSTLVERILGAIDDKIHL